MIQSTEENFNEKIKETDEESHNRVSKIKDICSKYFEQYDQVNKEVQIKFDKVNITFKEWKEVVLKPLNMSEARLYTAEVRIKEIEEKVFQNLARSKEVVKKLIFALEQESLPAKNSGATGSQKLSVDIPPESSYNSTPGDMSFLFLKRLLFLKNELDEEIPGNLLPPSPSPNPL